MTTDPYMAAHSICQDCGLVGYATDAVWLDSDRVLARFLPGCGHGEEQIRVLAPAALAVDQRCQAITRSGHRCKLPTAVGGWCAVHIPAHRGVG